MTPWLSPGYLVALALRAHWLPLAIAVAICAVRLLAARRVPRHGIAQRFTPARLDLALAVWALQATAATYREFDTHAAFNPEWRLAGAAEFLAAMFVALAIILLDLLGSHLRDRRHVRSGIPAPSIPLASFVILLTTLLDRAGALAAFSGADTLGP